MAQKLAKDITPSIDSVRVADLLVTWKQERRRRFMIFSGFWIPVIEQYLQEIEIPDISIDLCHMDASISTSWKLYNTTHPAFRDIWFFNWEKKKLSYYFPISEDRIVPYEKRLNRFLIHGGGWGVGTYKNKIPELEQQGIKLDVIAYEPQDLENQIEENRYFMIDPEWKPWEKNDMGEHQFPPFGEVKDDGEIVFENNKLYPEVYSLIQQSRAIISKPGGATLIDSLSAATPLIWLDPYGEYENYNGLLWEALGFAISYQKWAESGYSIDLLEQLHQNLLQARAGLASYVDYYAKTHGLSSPSIR
uniref:Putative diacylglycerol glucosyltransferase n=1 Tax=Prochloron didemni P1-Palau TaxID=910450 RepID=G0XS40_PRODI|nr:putative diacylglycerol glucosyltransferase [Prochloron didemni P1-Palau]